MTLNLGLRYEYETGMRDPEFRLSRSIDLGASLPGLADNTGEFPQQVLDLRTDPLLLNGAWSFTDSNNPRS